MTASLRLLLVAACCAHVLAFAPVPLRRPHRHAAVHFRMAETDDEIADLERKLKELKETKQAEEETAELPEVVKVEVKDGFDMTTLSMRKKVAVSGAPEVASELLSESWKEQDAAPGGGGDGGGLPIAQIAGGLLFAVALFAFAQVPVGQENLPEVTYGGKATRAETADEIRARYEKLGLVSDDMPVTPAE